MNPQKNQGEADSALLRGIQAEVSAENAPLLNLITRHAALIAAVMLLLLLALGGMGIWNWYQGGKLADAQAELARINAKLKGDERDQALARLAENAPGKFQLAAWLALAQSAQDNNKEQLAAKAYAKVAELDSKGGLGLAASLGQVANLLRQNENAQALKLLREIELKLPAGARPPQMGQFLAEAAIRAGDRELAAQAYESLAREVQGADSQYYRKRAEELRTGALNPAQNAPQGAKN